ncbi:cell division protein FtsQ [Nocardiopsis gilva YIM 90087]|uniref:Cell division protein FtsQ n=1 Tax=Nocardiopsis gilva YIM 90087 TaxID=1235441 RepID=A0A223S5M7_9ACTN|nr:FtsQ-type POTRA domain-containing protein [Nocardiopsis gilva]ASU83422.1 cell division protein FtsQ [Nocardiopsis gilva YIM 90087]
MGSGGPGKPGRPGRPDRPDSPRSSDPWKVAFVTLLIVALLAVVLWVLLGSRLLVVRDIRVTGVDRVSDQAVVQALDVPTGTPLARVDTGAAADRAAKLRLVESVEVTRGWPSTLRVEVTERTPRLALKVGDGYRLVDHEGVRIADVESRPDAFPLVRIRGEVKDNSGIAAAAAITEKLPDGVLSKVRTIAAEDPKTLVLKLDDGATVTWGDDERTKEKGEVLAILLREHPSNADRSYDVSAPDVAVVK